MRILSLKFKNLNSLLGQWSIDFTDPAYEDAGIFAITGPTGAGKSTLLDAISLALYGQTPRLGRITKSDNEIMSRQAGECSAELCFRTAMGDFRVVWSQHRARRKASGELQTPTHTLYDLSQQKEIADQLSVVPKQIETITGLDFERFTRSMLLAQGKFAAFLQAKPDERSPILEQITGTEIYSQISVLVHERRSIEKKARDELAAQLKGIELLSTQELQEVEAALCTAQKQLEQTKAQLNHWQAIGQHQKDKAALIEQQDIIVKDKQQLAIDIEAFKKSALVLSRAEKALQVQAPYQLLLRTEDGLTQLQQRLQQEQIQLPLLKEQQQSHQYEYKAQVEARKKFEQDFEAQRTLWQKVRALDVKIGQYQVELSALEPTLKALTERIANHKQRVVTTKTAVATCTKTKNKAHAFLDEHQIDAKIASRLSQFELMAQQEKHLQVQCLDLQSTLTKQQNQEALLKSDIQAPHALLNDLNVKLLSVQQEIAQAEAALIETKQGKTTSQWRNQLNADQQVGAALKIEQQRLVTIRASQKQLIDLEREHTQLLVQKKEVEAAVDIAAQTVKALQQQLELIKKTQELERVVFNLQQERARLVDGEPCPLCGSKEHPYAYDLPSVMATDSAIKDCRQQMHSEETRHNELVVKQAALNLQVGIQSQALQQLKKLIAKECELFYQKLHEYGLSQLIMGNEPADGNKHVQWYIKDLDNAICFQQAQLNKIEELEQLIVEKQKSERHLIEQKNQLCTQVQGFMQRIELAIHRQQECIQALREAKNKRESQRRLLQALAADFDITLELSDVAFQSDWLDQLKQRSQAWQAQQELLQATTAKTKLLEQQLQHEQAQLTDWSEQQAKLSERKSILINNKAVVEQERRQLFGDQHVEDVIQSWELRRTRFSAELDQSYARMLAAEKAYEKRQSLLAELSKTITEESALRQSQKISFFAQLERLGFVDQDDFIAAQLDDSVRLELIATQSRLKEKEQELKLREQLLQEHLSTWQAKKMDECSLEYCAEQIDHYNAQLQHDYKAFAQLQAKQDQYQRAQDLHASQLSALEKQEQSYAKWSALHELIGSADGKKFRNFAQGLTFELMVAQANLQLQKMSDRYLLVRSETEPLELNVIDNYQAGEIRPTKNVSGGESFIISLALALGLAQMASENVRIDSLFLDEGFGTLDEQALDMALETLASLQHEGKLIGVISHVPALKERITTQIQIDILRTGHSSLKGPGCIKIKD